MSGMKPTAPSGNRQMKASRLASLVPCNTYKTIASKKLAEDRHRSYAMS
jgi:hypothetical protein